eukprot:TRINITY_DN24861_c0_g1_i1.p1 TRINITY_DN24861_c0_g1~~TRINITY_DN24861_c0_g1_i1.p1  ORF type:complete len:3337 (-),score=1053.15 TRINITY_DN24861_c0_g1_i1:29-10039(-)
MSAPGSSSGSPVVTAPMPPPAWLSELAATVAEVKQGLEDVQRSHDELRSSLSPSERPLSQSESAAAEKDGHGRPSDGLRAEEDEVAVSSWRQRFAERLSEVEQSLAEVVGSRAEELGQLTQRITSEGFWSAAEIAVDRQQPVPSARHLDEVGQALQEVNMRLELLEHCARARDEAYAQLSRKVEDQRKRREEVESRVLELEEQLSTRIEDCVSETLAKGTATSIAISPSEASSTAAMLANKPLAEVLAHAQPRSPFLWPNSQQDAARRAAALAELDTLQEEVRLASRGFETDLRRYAEDLEELKENARKVDEAARRSAQSLVDDACGALEAQIARLAETVEALAGQRTEVQASLHLCVEEHSEVAGQCAELRQRLSDVEAQAREVAAMVAAGAATATTYARAPTPDTEDSRSGRATPPEPPSPSGGAGLPSTPRLSRWMNKSPRQDSRSAAGRYDGVLRRLQDRMDGMDKALADVNANRSGTVSFADSPKTSSNAPARLEERLETLERALEEVVANALLTATGASAAIASESPRQWPQQLQQQELTTTFDSLRGREKDLAGGMRQMTLEAEELREDLAASAQGQARLEMAFGVLQGDLQRGAEQAFEVQSATKAAAAAIEAECSRTMAQQAELRSELKACLDELQALRRGSLLAAEEAALLEGLLRQSQAERAAVAEEHAILHGELLQNAEDAAGLQTVLQEAQRERKSLQEDLECLRSQLLRQAELNADMARNSMKGESASPLLQDAPGFGLRGASRSRSASPFQDKEKTFLKREVDELRALVQDYTRQQMPAPSAGRAPSSELLERLVDLEGRVSKLAASAVTSKDVDTLRQELESSTVTARDLSTLRQDIVTTILSSNSGDSKRPSTLPTSISPRDFDVLREEVSSTVLILKHMEAVREDLAATSVSSEDLATLRSELSRMFISSQQFEEMRSDMLGSALSRRNVEDICRSSMSTLVTVEHFDFLRREFETKFCSHSDFDLLRGMVDSAKDSTKQLEQRLASATLLAHDMQLEQRPVSATFPSQDMQAFRERLETTMAAVEQLQNQQKKDLASRSAREAQCQSFEMHTPRELELEDEAAQRSSSQSEAIITSEAEDIIEAVRQELLSTMVSEVQIETLQKEFGIESRTVVVDEPPRPDPEYTEGAFDASMQQKLLAASREMREQGEEAWTKATKQFEELRVRLECLEAAKEQQAATTDRERREDTVETRTELHIQREALASATKQLEDLRRRLAQLETMHQDIGSPRLTAKELEDFGRELSSTVVRPEQLDEVRRELLSAMEEKQKETAAAVNCSPHAEMQQADRDSVALLKEDLGVSVASTEQIRDLRVELASLSAAIADESTKGRQIEESLAAASRAATRQELEELRQEVQAAAREDLQGVLKKFTASATFVTTEQLREEIATGMKSSNGLLQQLQKDMENAAGKTENLQKLCDYVTSTMVTEEQLEAFRSDISAAVVTFEELEALRQELHQSASRAGVDNEVLTRDGLEACPEDLTQAATASKEASAAAGGNESGAGAQTTSEPPTGPRLDVSALHDETPVDFGASQQKLMAAAAAARDIEVLHSEIQVHTVTQKDLDAIRQDLKEEVAAVAVLAKQSLEASRGARQEAQVVLEEFAKKGEVEGATAAAKHALHMSQRLEPALEALNNKHAQSLLCLDALAKKQTEDVEGMTSVLEKIDGKQASQLEKLEKKLHDHESSLQALHGRLFKEFDGKFTDCMKVVQELLRTKLAEESAVREGAQSGIQADLQEFAAELQQVREGLSNEFRKFVADTVYSIDDIRSSLEHKQAEREAFHTGMQEQVSRHREEQQAQRALLEELRAVADVHERGLLEQARIQTDFSIQGQEQSTLRGLVEQHHDAVQQQFQELSEGFGEVRAQQQKLADVEKNWAAMHASSLSTANETIVEIQRSMEQVAVDADARLHERLRSLEDVQRELLAAAVEGVQSGMEAKLSEEVKLLRQEHVASVHRTKAMLDGAAELRQADATAHAHSLEELQHTLRTETASRELLRAELDHGLKELADRLAEDRQSVEQALRSVSRAQETSTEAQAKSIDALQSALAEELSVRKTLQAELQVQQLQQRESQSERLEEVQRDLRERQEALLAAGLQALGKEEEIPTISFELQFEEMCLENFDEAKRRAYCGSLAAALACDRVEIVGTRAGSLIVETRAAGFSESQVASAAQRLLALSYGGSTSSTPTTDWQAAQPTLLDEGEWGRSIIPRPPRLTKERRQVSVSQRLDSLECSLAEAQAALRRALSLQDGRMNLLESCTGNFAKQEGTVRSLAADCKAVAEQGAKLAQRLASVEAAVGGAARLPMLDTVAEGARSTSVSAAAEEASRPSPSPRPETRLSLGPVGDELLSRTSASAAGPLAVDLQVLIDEGEALVTQDNEEEARRRSLREAEAGGREAPILARLQRVEKRLEEAMRVSASSEDVQAVHTVMQQDREAVRSQGLFLETLQQSVPEALAVLEASLAGKHQCLEEAQQRMAEDLRRSLTKEEGLLLSSELATLSEALRTLQAQVASEEQAAEQRMAEALRRSLNKEEGRLLSSELAALSEALRTLQAQVASEEQARSADAQSLREALGAQEEFVLRSAAGLRAQLLEDAARERTEARDREEAARQFLDNQVDVQQTLAQVQEEFAKRMDEVTERLDAAAQQAEKTACEMQETVEVAQAAILAAGQAQAASVANVGAEERLDALATQMQQLSERLEQVDSYPAEDAAQMQWLTFQLRRIQEEKLPEVLESFTAVKNSVETFQQSSSQGLQEKLLKERQDAMELLGDVEGRLNHNLQRSKAEQAELQEAQEAAMKQVTEALADVVTSQAASQTELECALEEFEMKYNGKLQAALSKSSEALSGEVHARLSEELQKSAFLSLQSAEEARKLVEVSQSSIASALAAELATIRKAFSAQSRRVLDLALCRERTRGGVLQTCLSDWHRATQEKKTSREAQEIKARLLEAEAVQTQFSLLLTQEQSSRERALGVLEKGIEASARATRQAEEKIKEVREESCKLHHDATTAAAAEKAMAMEREAAIEKAAERQRAVAEKAVAEAEAAKAVVAEVQRRQQEKDAAERAMAEERIRMKERAAAEAAVAADRLLQQERLSLETTLEEGSLAQRIDSPYQGGELAEAWAEVSFMVPSSLQQSDDSRAARASRQQPESSPVPLRPLSATISSRPASPRPPLSPFSTGVERKMATTPPPASTAKAEPGSVGKKERLGQIQETLQKLMTQEARVRIEAAKSSRRPSLAGIGGASQDEPSMPQAPSLAMSGGRLSSAASPRTPPLSPTPSAAISQLRAAFLAAGMTPPKSPAAPSVAPSVPSSPSVR